MSAVDGPGLRTVIFFQGCAMRCLYCHNPDTWAVDAGEIEEAQALAKSAARAKRFFGTLGGVTLSGGEPLMQSEFALELVRALHGLDVQVALDTSGFIGGQDKDCVRALLDEVDLVLLDIKHADADVFLRLTGQDSRDLLYCMERLRKTQRPVWLRQVIVPGITQDAGQMAHLARLATGMNLQKLELLPYHTLGAHKWDQLGMRYALQGICPPTQQEMSALEMCFAKEYGGNVWKR